MTFYTAGDLRTQPQNIWDNLSVSNELVITNNGKPTALMLHISESNFEELIKAVRQAKAMIAFNSMRGKAAKRGFMTNAEIDAEITAVRQARKNKKN